MLAFARELLCEVVQEAQPLLQAHHRELKPYAGAMKLDPQWETYAFLQQMGRYVIVTARCQGKLVGYGGFHVIRHLQDQNFVVAQNDVFYLEPAHRHGIVVRAFVYHCERQLKGEGAMHIAFFTSPQNNFSALLGRIGYSDEQAMLGKPL